jgi:hypothetical protein
MVKFTVYPTSSHLDKATMLQLMAALLGLACRVTAHGGALNYTVGDTWYPGSVYMSVSTSRS